MMSTRRVYIGNSGGQFYFRASLKDVDALAGDLTRMSAYENTVPCVPKASGSVVMAPDSVQTVASGLSFAYPPLVIVKATDGTLPGDYTVGGWFIAGSPAQLKIFNKTSRTITVKWFAFAEL